MTGTKKTAVAVGNFDGFHLGHRKILKRMRTLAESRGLETRVLTFTPNPKVYFGLDVPLIFTDAQKAEILETQQVDRIIFIPFATVVGLSPGEFLRRVLLQDQCMAALVVGENFRFGSGRTGDIGFLRRTARVAGFDLEAVPPLTCDGGRISSSRIRSLLMDGAVEKAARLLGRHYFIDGEVVSGAGRGRKLGFPTVNLDSENRVLPEGVFVTRVDWRGRRFAAVTNIGSSPTFGRSFKQVETHILDFDKQIYGQRIRLHFLQKLRDEFRFDSTSDLVEQIRRDVKMAAVDSI